MRAYRDRPVGRAMAVENVAAASGLPVGPETLEQTTLTSYEYARHMTVLELASALQTVNELTRAIAEFFTNWDLLITPTAATLLPSSES